MTERLANTVRSCGALTPAAASAFSTGFGNRACMRAACSCETAWRSSTIALAKVRSFAAIAASAASTGSVRRVGASRLSVFANQRYPAVGHRRARTLGGVHASWKLTQYSLRSVTGLDASPSGRPSTREHAGRSSICVTALRAAAIRPTAGTGVRPVRRSGTIARRRQRRRLPRR